MNISGAEGHPVRAGEWKLVPLNEAGKLVAGTNNRSINAWGGTVPWVSPKDMKTFEIEDAQDHVSQTHLDSRVKLVPEGAVLIVVHSSILLRMLPVAVAMRELVINQDLKALIPKEGFDPRFIAYTLRANTPSILSRCIKRGATVPTLDSEQLQHEKILVPAPGDPTRSLEIQRRIARRLDGLFAELRKSREILDRMLADVGRVMNSALGETVNNLDCEFPNTVTVGELCSRGQIEIIGGDTPSKKNEAYWKGTVPWVSPKDMKSWRISDSQDHVSEAAIKEEKLKVLPVGAVLLVVRGMALANNLPMAITDNHVTISQDIKALIPREGILSDYLGYIFRARKQTLLQSVGVTGHGTHKLASEILNSVAIPMPTSCAREELSNT